MSDHDQLIGVAQRWERLYCEAKDDADALSVSYRRLTEENERLQTALRERCEEVDALRSIASRAVGLLRHTKACDASRDRFPCICGVDEVVAAWSEGDAT